MRIGKIAAVGFALVALMTGFGLTMVGGTLLTLTDGPDGVISAPGLGVSTDNVALLGDEVDLWVDPDVGTPDLFVNDFKVSVTADSLNGKDVFVGVGPAVEVREYIGDADPDRFRVVNDDLEIVQGSGQDPLAPPAGEDFWTATNADGTFEWRPTTGEWAIVVLNADGSAGIDTILDVEATIPFLRPVAAMLFGVGIFGLGVGAFLLYLGVRSTPRRETLEAPAPPREPANVG